MNRNQLAGVIAVPAQFSSNGVWIGYEYFAPDETKAYVEFNVSHSFPVVTAYGTALHPAVIARSFQTLKHQNFNYGHRIKRYDPENINQDSVLGSVVAVEYPIAPEGGWKIPATKDSSPHIHGVAVMHKQAQRVDRILGEFQSGKTKLSVSMEVRYYLDESAFAINSGSGWDILPWETAPQDLRDTFDVKKRTITGNYRGKRPALLMGGTDGTVHYSGLGLVQYPAEKEATILSMLAGGVTPDWDADDPAKPAQPDPMAESLRTAANSLSTLALKL